MMKKTKLLFTLSALVFSTQVFANDSVSYNANVTNNYLWRGLEQTNGNAALQAGVDYAADSGFYLGAWASNASWADGVTTEVDLYGGYASSVESVSYDIGFMYYAYPDATDDLDFTEVYFNVSFGNVSLGYATLASAEGADFGDDTYLSASVDFELSNDYGLTLAVGSGTDDFYAGEKYVHYGFTLSKGPLSFGLSKTDLDDDDVKVLFAYAFAL